MLRLIAKLGAVFFLAAFAAAIAPSWSWACDESVTAEADSFSSAVELEGVRSCSSVEKDETELDDVLQVAQSVGDPGPSYASEPLWGVHPETGEVCLDLQLSATVTMTSAVGLLWEVRMVEMYFDPRLDDVQYRWCDAASAALIADPSPDVRAFIRSIPLPEPDVAIAPGWALTGLPAYLEISNQDPFDATGVIPGFGQLEVSLQPRSFVIDWGDGAIEHVDDGRTGVPWDGPEELQISHTYIDTDDDLTVTVEGSWLAVWQLGGFSGVVTDLNVTSSFDLPVRAKQAVRTAP